MMMMPSQSDRWPVALYAIRYNIGDVFARHTGYNDVGELNDIIIIYPQATANRNLSNSLGCWDYWGYTVDFYGK